MATSKQTSKINETVINISQPNNKLDLDELAKNKPLRETFSLETCSVSYKDNVDYQTLVGSLIALKNQRKRAIENLNKLLEIEKNALEDPLNFLEDVQHNKIQFPEREELLEVPLIDWSFYEKEIEVARKPSSIRTMRIKQEPIIVEKPAPTIPKVYVPDKSNPSFNRQWSTEEQLLLEELLVTYPSEAVESKRYAKIAAMLPNRNKQQVASRVQKYFKKLAKNGLPVPGRKPKKFSSDYKAKNKRRRNFFNNNMSTNYSTSRSSTFLASVEPRVYMTDDPRDKEFAAPAAPRGRVANTCPQVASVIDEHKKNNKFTQENKQDSSNQHLGYQCNMCQMEPIIGDRYHCNECPEEICVDLCCNCVNSSYRSKEHTGKHTFNCISTPETYIEDDYTGQFSYLDPNFMPGTV